ncbi:UNVERIFIED_CONTAM: hypothetical protein RMT77_014831 [Armadillidium vulgare]
MAEMISDISLRISSSATRSTIISSGSTTPVSSEPLIMDIENSKDGCVKTKMSSIYKVYPIRWVILLLFVAYSMSNAFQWIQYSIITNIIMTYYGVTATWVDWCSMIYMVTYIPLIFPASWYLERQGLRRAVLIGSCGTMIGAWIKCGSVDENRFWLSFIGQMVSAMSQIFILGIPPRLAAVWFSADQVSTACAVGVFGNQLGVAMGFLLPPVIVPTSEDKDEIAHGLRIMFFGVASLCTALFILIIFVFKEKPETPPSAAAKSALEEESGSYLGGILRLMRNRNYILLLLSYGMNVGVFYGISTLLNQTVLQYFPGQTKSAGQIGLLIVIAGMFGSVVCGIILDKTAKFKLVTAGIYGLSFVFMIIYTFILEVKILALVFLMAACLGFFMTGYLPVGFEFAAELTFPEAEGTSSGLLNASAQIFGIICTMVGSKLMVFSSDKVVNSVFCGVLLVGAILTVCIKEDLRRQSARRKASPVDTIMASPELEDGQRI